MKKKIIIVALAAVLTATTMIGGSLAYFSAEGNKVQQQINTMTLGIKLQDVVVDAEGKEIAAEPIDGALYVERVMPGEVVDKTMRVNNPEEVTEYVRVSVRKYWTKNSGDEVVKLPEKDANAIILKPVNAEEDERERWIVTKETDEHIILYYTKPLAEGENTKNFMEQIMISEKIKNDYAGLGVALEFETEGIQVFAAQDAFLSEWGVKPVIDEDGYILQIEE